MPACAGITIKEFISDFFLVLYQALFAPVAVPLQHLTSAIS
jgi:hypothetical protein